MLLCGRTSAALCFASGTFSLYLLWDYLRSRRRVGGLHKKSVFITGCDSGFGHALAVRLDSLGVPVFAGCFTESGEKETKEKCSESLQTIRLDVTSPESIRQAYEYVKSNLPEGAVLWGVVNNAGVMVLPGPAELASRQDYLHTLTVNFLGAVEVTTTFLPLLMKSKGRIVNMASTAVLGPLPGLAPYSASKYAVRSFSDILRLEKAPWGISVSCVMPAGFRTNLFNVFTKENWDMRWAALSAELREEYGEDYPEREKKSLDNIMQSSSGSRADLSPVVDAYEHALFARAPRAHYYPGVEAKMAVFLSWLPGAWQEAVAMKLFPPVVPQALQ